MSKKVWGESTKALVNMLLVEDKSIPNEKGEVAIVQPWSDIDSHPLVEIFTIILLW